MSRGTLSRWVRLGVGVVGVLIFAPTAMAFDVTSSYPLASGTRWTYDVEIRSSVTSGSEVLERYLTGWTDEEVLGPSSLSGVGSVVYKVRTRIALGAEGAKPVINKTFTTHRSAVKQGILIHGVDSTVFRYPSLLLSANPPVNEPVDVSVNVMDEVPTINRIVTIKQLGTLHVRVELKSKTKEKIEVPAGSFRKAIKLVEQGTVYGRLGGGYALRVGSITTTSWYAKGVGLVRSHTSYYLKVRAPDGASLRINETETYRLTSFKSPPK